MCGIVGIAPRDGTPVSRAILAEMVARIRHRGPDGEGLFVDDQVGLGHARLSIIDPRGGHQPMANSDGSVRVVFNGEIFNYRELRQGLIQRGHRFVTASDTEVIVHLYEEHGDRFMDHLNGQFAIAIWDCKRRALLLVRDRVGIRPLYYVDTPRALIFASEAKALFADPRVAAEIDLSSLAEVFTFWAPLDGRSIFAGVRSVPPGHVLKVEGGHRCLRRYWDWSFPEVGDYDPRPLPELVDGFRELFEDSVRLQLQADVPVAAYLSGGLDSSYVAATASRLHASELRTFSLRFTDAEFDEGPYQTAARAVTGDAHTEVLCHASSIAENFPKAIWHAEVPVLRTAPVPMMLLAEQVRAHGSRVVLTGEGADEILCGYDLFKEGRIRRFCARQPQSEARAALFGRLYPYLRHSPVAAPAYARRFFSQGAQYQDAPYFAHIPRWQTTRKICQYLSEDALAEIARRPLYADLEAQLPQSIRGWASLNQDQYVEAHTLLSGYLLSAQGDRMAAAHGIESRVPFLDHRLIEYCNRLPPRYKLMGLNEKFLLKQAAAGVVPDRVRLRPKQPYRAPDSASFFSNGEAVDYVQYLLSEDRLRAVGYLNAAAVGKLVEKCRRGRAIGFGDNMAFVGLLSLMLLDEQFVRGRMVPGSQEFGATTIDRSERELIYAAS